MNGSLTFFMFSLSFSLSQYNDTGVVEAVGLVEYNSQTLQGLRTEVQFYTSPPPTTTRLEQMFSVYLYTQLELVNYWCEYFKERRGGGGGGEGTVYFFFRVYSSLNYNCDMCAHMVDFIAKTFCVQRAEQF